ncbi:MAG: DUF475 domain-containing protein [Bdellovibrionaceae bacterium]|nr:DUF475 domain-containing protein [Pseudobdellovibrionaceae bacterium]
MMQYFRVSFIFTFIGILLSAWLGYSAGGMTGLVQTVFIASVLAVLEVSLSFDNAIVNAIILKQMTPIWRHRFLTWGIAIAVFGMRLVFPLALVSVVAQIDPWSALNMAIFDPKGYADRMLSAHLEVAAFGGSFLLLVGLKYFYDENKDEHWIKVIEEPLVKLGRLDAIEIAVSLVVLLLIMGFLPEDEKVRFIKSGLWGVITFVAVDGIGTWLELSGKQQNDINRASAGMFLYLEVLDASFSFDGVIGAFAITQNLFIIMIGLSIGAFFVRSLTIMFVEKETLNKFAYLEHGAFYAILSLALMMLLDPFFHIPEWVTGLLGAAIITVSFIWSVKFAPASESGKS